MKNEELLKEISATLLTEYTKALVELKMDSERSFNHTINYVGDLSGSNKQVLRHLLSFAIGIYLGTEDSLKYADEHLKKAIEVEI